LIPQPIQKLRSFRRYSCQGDRKAFSTSPKRSLCGASMGLSCPVSRRSAASSRSSRRSRGSILYPYGVPTDVAGMIRSIEDGRPFIFAWPGHAWVAYGLYSIQRRLLRRRSSSRYQAECIGAAARSVDIPDGCGNCRHSAGATVVLITRLWGMGTRWPRWGITVRLIAETHSTSGRCLYPCKP
jgi:hypothetical protein